MDDRTAQLADYFAASGAAHHQAFLDTDGADSEWPLWYATHMHSRLNELLNVSLTKSELVYWLVRLDREYRRENPGEPWPTNYSRKLIAELADNERR